MADFTNRHQVLITFRCLGIKSDSFLTITDEEDDEPFVNVSVAIQATYVHQIRRIISDRLTLYYSTKPLGDIPIKSAVEDADENKIKIPTKPKKEVAPETNGHYAMTTNGTNISSTSNGVVAVEESKNAKRPHPDDAAEISPAKRTKTAASAKDDDVVLVDDSAGGGAIVIDDD